MKMQRLFLFSALLFASAVRAEDGPVVERCTSELGTLAVAEPQSFVISGLRRYGLGSPSTMLRMIAQQSGCFVIVERGVAMRNLEQERILAESGDLQADSNIGKGQLQGADFVMTPAVQFADDSGGIAGSVSNLFSQARGALGVIGGMAGGVKFKEAETTLLVSDVRSGIQVASAEGKASKMDFSLGGWGWGGLGWATAGGYSKTPEGKLIAASLLDNFNKIVLAVRDKPSLVRTSVQASKKNAANSLPATGTSRPVPTAAPATTAALVATPAAATSTATTAASVATAGAPLPAGLTGAFSGQYSGADSGIYSIMIEADGQITGVGQTASSKAFDITGSVRPNGSFAMSGSADGGEAQFSGIINAKSGAVVGTWRLAQGGAKGTFTGKRQ